MESGRPGIEYAQAAAEWAGHPLDNDQLALLEAYAEWLEREAIPAGGLGPREGPKLWQRHVADSLTFATAWPDTPPPDLLDVGSGVGLPGIPLSIAWPECHVPLLDRGGRRPRLLGRVVRVLGLEHVRVAQGDAFDVADEWSGLAYRGSVRPPEAVGLSGRLLAEGGRAVLGLSRRPERPERAPDLIGIAAAMGLEATLQSVPEHILDGPAWLLIMHA